VLDPLTLVGLCRLAGLRRGEALEFVWSGRAVDRDGAERWVGVDFGRCRLCIVAVKTGKYREVPIVPMLWCILAEQAEAMPGETLVVPCRQVSRNNLRARLLAIIKRAGLKRWPKLFQTLRSSCENQWKTEGIAEATYSVWLGHSIEVSRKHYVQPLESEFDNVTRSGEKLSQELSQSKADGSLQLLREAVST